ncbi:hypothetical protein DFP72DRAFT_243267 [Ephemerocybe angulata]|uniref:Uncharacterized protein n=1 Tax=Ephemerocybe angulata TaxID=980116 RepID=A0A8H6LUV6_9AGAR|nr:hypothetical protein DFP72DRAFT_243267 [Tulosesus angulatus]
MRTLGGGGELLGLERRRRRRRRARGGRRRIKGEGEKRAGEGKRRKERVGIETSDTWFNSKDRLLAGKEEEDRKGRGKKKNALAQAVSRAFDFDFGDEERDREREREKEIREREKEMRERERERERDRDVERESQKSNDILENTLFKKKIKARGGGVPPITTSAHAQGIVAPSSPIGASPMPNHDSQNPTSSAATSTNALLDFSFSSSRKKSKKNTPATTSATAALNALDRDEWRGERPGTAGSGSTGHSGSQQHVGGGTNSSSAASNPPFVWVSRSKVVDETRGSESPVLVSAAPSRRVTRMQEENAVLDVSSRGSSKSREAEGGSVDVKGKRPAKKRTASVPNLGFDQQPHRDLSKVPFDSESGVLGRAGQPFDQGPEYNPYSHSQAYDSDAAVVSVVKGNRRKTSEGRLRQYIRGEERGKEMDMVKAIPVLRSLKSKSSGQLR